MGKFFVINKNSRARRKITKIIERNPQNQKSQQNPQNHQPD